jgi:hypothetical protein
VASVPGPRVRLIHLLLYTYLTLQLLARSILSHCHNQDVLLYYKLSSCWYGTYHPSATTRTAHPLSTYSSRSVVGTLLVRYVSSLCHNSDYLPSIFYIYIYITLRLLVRYVSSLCRNQDALLLLRTLQCWHGPLNPTATARTFYYCYIHTPVVGTVRIIPLPQPGRLSLIP